MSAHQMTGPEKMALSAGDRFMEARRGRRGTVTHAYTENARRLAYVTWDDGVEYAGLWSLGAMDLWTVPEPARTR